MTGDLERDFFVFPVQVRLTIVAALQAVIADPGPFASADDAADVLVRLGFPGSAAAARNVGAWTPK